MTLAAAPAAPGALSRAAGRRPFTVLSPGGPVPTHEPPGTTHAYSRHPIGPWIRGWKPMLNKSRTTF